MRTLRDALIAGVLLFPAAESPHLEAGILRVPAEHATVGSAVASFRDGSIARFLKDLYAGLARGESGTAALRGAEIAALRSRYGHPRRWAGSVLLGSDGAFAVPPGETRKDLWPEAIRRSSSSTASTSQ
jgi:hypothetical protein